ncbi:hypothetical protein [uncultured Corynebacterium sp.]|uniref:hypothetical protein n=1 Tax=uncultured Corynebacterium sp. TaxID=159447 RepID=UPI00261B1DA4|nr:hypothetical protein [uncultured Corynebacterium sp.]
MNTYTTISADTHKIHAGYDINGIDYSLSFDTNGHTLQEVIDDAIEFWNEAEGSHHDFEVSSETENDGYVEITISGHITDVYNEGEPVNTITVTIIAEETE